NNVEKVKEFTNKVTKNTEEILKKFSDEKEKIAKVSKEIEEEVKKFSTEISNTIKEEIFRNIKGRIEEYLYETLDEVYYNFQLYDKPESYYGQETSNEGQTSTKHMSLISVEQGITGITNDKSVINYKTDKIRNLFSKAMREKRTDIINVITAEKDNFAELQKNITERLKATLDNNDSKDIDMEHIIFIICAIIDSESLIFLDNISKDYTKKVKAHVESSKNIRIKISFSLNSKFLEFW
ncbi:12337_t:CDS:1, partial [Ambispora leptoticha]